MGLWHSHDDNHFLLKIYRMDEKEFLDYYTYHLNYALQNNLANEEDFFTLCMADRTGWGQAL